MFKNAAAGGSHVSVGVVDHRTFVGHLNKK